MIEIVAVPNDVMFREISETTWSGVEGFPHRMSTEATTGDPEYEEAMEQRRGMRDSENPLISTVSWSDLRVVGSRRILGSWQGLRSGREVAPTQ